MFQKTIKKSITCSGVGLHSGKKVGLTLRPAPVDSGITFCLSNGEGHTYIKPSPDSVVSTQLATTLTNGSGAVSTVEHILATVRGLGVDNIRIEVTDAEVPIMDGSAAGFVYLFREAGIVEQSKPCKVFKLKKAIEFKRDGKWVKASPYNGFKVDYTIDFNHPTIGRQTLSFELTPESFTRSIAKARTFGFLKEVEYMQANKLALGGSLDNAIVLDDYGVVNDEGLRFRDEFVRHKILDFVGDMAVLEYPLWGHFEVHASGHALNNEFLRQIAANADDYLEEAVLKQPEPAAEKMPQQDVAAAAVPA